jgi:molybdopterin converting factor subunit 1
VAVTVLYFAALRDLAGTAEEQLDITAGTSVAEVLAQLRGAHDRLRYEGVRCAVNEEFVRDDHLVFDGDVLALIPPVSGG